MIIREISSADTLSLRNEVLRPGKDISECIFDSDDAPDTRHFGAIDTQNNIVGIVSVYRSGNPSITGINPYQIRAMAIRSTCRGQGLGSSLLTSAENYAKSRSSTLIWANARSSVIGFYTQSGYSLASDEFVIDGIGPHYLVTKSLA